MGTVLPVDNPEPKGGSSPGIARRRAMELLADGEWHDRRRIITAVAAIVQPGPALRYAVKHLKTPLDDTDPDMKERYVHSGQRSLALNILNDKERFERDGDRIRLIPYVVITPEQYSERSRRGAMKLTPEQRSEKAKRSAARMTPEERSERARRGGQALTAEQRSERSKRAAAKIPREERAERTRRAAEAMTAEQRRARALKAAQAAAQARSAAAAARRQEK